MYPNQIGGNLPSNLNNIVQRNMLTRMWQDALKAKLGYRDAATKKSFAPGVGPKLIENRPGRLVANGSPINPATITPLDSGVGTPYTYAMEQYTRSVETYGNSVPDLDYMVDKLGVVDLFLQNTQNLAEQSQRSIDLSSRDTLFDAYMGQNTSVTVTLGAPSATIQVDDIRGFTLTFSNGLLQPTSPTNTQNVRVGSNIYTLIGAAASGAPTQQFRAIPGTLTFSTNVTVLDGTQYNPVISSVAPKILRPNGRKTTYALTLSDTLTLDTILQAKSYLSANAIPPINGLYNCYLDSYTISQLYSDPRLVQLFQTTGFSSPEFGNAIIAQALGIRFITLDVTPQQRSFITQTPDVTINVDRAIVCGADCLIESRFEGAREVYARLARQSGFYNVVNTNDIFMITREPLDRLGRFLSQAWTYIGGFVAPTDSTVNQSIINTASNAYYKRAVVIEVASAATD